MNRKINSWLIIALLIIVAGAGLTVWSARQQDASLRTDLLTETRIAALGTSAGQVLTLSGSAEDLTSPDYRALRAQLERIRTTTPQARFASLMGRRADQTIFFYADSDSPASGDSSPSEQDYPEALAGAQAVFATGREVITGPYSDLRGTRVSSFVPVMDAGTGNVIAVFRMDVDAADWNLLIFRSSLPTLIATLLILLLVLVSAFFWKGSEEEQRKAVKSEELLCEKESFQQVLLDNLTSGIVIVDAKTHIIELVNPAAAAMFGAPPDQITGRKCHQLICTADEGGCPVTDRHREVENSERLMLRSDGTTIPVLKSVKKIRIRGEEKLLENFIDITRRKEAEESLQRQTATLSILNEIISVANKADNLLHLLNSILEESIHLLDFDAGGIYLVDRATRTANVVISKNLKKEFLADIQTVSIDDTPYDTLFIKNEPIILESYAQIAPDRSKMYGFYSMASIPLLSKGVAIGALNIVSTRRHLIYEDKKQTLISIGRELGSTIERMASEEEGKKAKKNLETLFNSIDEMIFVLDMQGHILVVNDTVLKSLSYTSEELTGTDVLLLHVPELRDEALRNVQGMIAGTIDSCPVPLLAKDGTRIEVETKVTRGLWNGSEVLIGVSRDITERKRAEEEIKRQAGLIRSLIDSIPDIIFFKDTDGVYLGCNPPFAKFAGKRVEEIIGSTDYELFDKEIADFFKENDKRMLESGKSRHNEEWITYPDGRKILIDTLKTPYRGPDGTLIGVLGISRDITDHKRAEEALLQLSDRLSLATRAGGVGIWDYDVVNNTLNWDDQMFALYGITREQFGGAYEAWQAGLHPADRGQGDAEIRQALSGEKEFDTVFRVLWPDGTIHTIRALALVQRDVSGKPLRMIGTNWDITDQKNAEAALLENDLLLRLILSLSARFINIPYEKIYPEIGTALGELGRFSGVDRSYVFLLSKDGMKLNNTHEWCADGILPLRVKLQDLPTGMFPWWMEKLKTFKTIHVPCVADLPEEAANEKEILQSQDIKSVLVVPLITSNTLIGFLGFDSVRNEKVWPENIITLVTITGKSISNAIEREHAEEALKKSEEQLSLVIEGSGVGLWDWQVQTGEVVFNERWAAIPGYTLAELSPLSIDTWNRLCVKEDLTRSEQLLKKHFKKESPIYECEVRMLHKDGHPVWVLDRGKVVEWDAEDRPVRMTGTHLDITERKRAEEAVLAANKKLNILNSVTRHDVLNQIQVLIMLLQIVEENTKDKETIEFVRKAEGATERITRQIDFTKEYQDIGIQAPQWQNAADIIRSAKSQLTECPYELLVDIDPVEIYADPLLLKVFYNLLENAIRHGEHVSTVRFFCYKSDDGLTLVCEDDGAGVDAESKKHLFRRGYGKHTGYGLYLMREILSISGITIKECGEPGKGARFEMTVPEGAFRTIGKRD